MALPMQETEWAILRRRGVLAACSTPPPLHHHHPSPPLPLLFLGGVSHFTELVYCTFLGCGRTPAPPHLVQSTLHSGMCVYAGCRERVCMYIRLTHPLHCLRLHLPSSGVGENHILTS